MTMIVAIILGMGLPTTAAYLILATVVAPALSEIGVPMLTAHMFVFFFGCVSTITPPVALAAYVAAGIAKAVAPEYPSGPTSHTLSPAISVGYAK